MINHSPIGRLVGASMLVASLATAAHAQLTGDTCTDPIQFSGDGVVSLDMSTMVQPSAHNWNGQGCVEQSINPESDAYICWTATVDGLVDVPTRTCCPNAAPTTTAGNRASSAAKSNAAKNT